VFASNELAYLGRGLDAVDLQSLSASRALLLGGEPFAEEIHQWWNFVGHSQEEIAQALVDWNTNPVQRFGEVEGYIGERLAAPELPW
jgi:redox-sensitive bicupin YhaK (pirin superfamily)